MIINTKELKDVVKKIVAKIVPQKTTMPILKMMLFHQHSEGFIKLSANNLETALTIIIPVDGKTNGFCVPAREISNLLEKVNTETIEIEELENKILVKIDGSQYEFKTMPPNEFPIAHYNSDTVEIDSLEFIRAIDRSLISLLSQNGLEVLGGVSIQSLDGKLSIASADGKRMSYTEIDTRLPTFDVIIPGNSAKIITNSANNFDKIHIGVTERQFCVFDDRIFITSQLIDGNFPHIQNIIPQEWETEVNVSKQELENKIKCAEIFADENTKMITIKITDNKFEIFSENNSVGRSVSSINDFAKRGTDNMISVNCSYLLDAIKSAKDRVILKMNQSFQPMGVFVPDCKEFIHIVMPMNLKGR